ncbi:MAG: Na+-transporting NADH:ubiquinone oxidoreductase subunit C [Arcticibacterium sp.]|jgi:Na+-transporting NADH:ubiquinone oxidoreductase subunit C
MHSNRYTFLYAIGISVVTAVILVLIAQQLKPLQEANVALDARKNILKSVLVNEEEADAVNKAYEVAVEEMVVNSAGEVIEDVKVDDVDMKREVAKSPEERRLPLYVFTAEGGEKSYIIPLRGVGLWGPIWGYVSLRNDFNTIHGATFDHKGETPGLGAEITEPFFQDQFQGKKVLDGEGTFVSINVMKATRKSELSSDNRVDGISGGTITSDGADDMLKNCIEPYLSYFNKLKSN